MVDRVECFLYIAEYCLYFLQCIRRFKDFSSPVQIRRNVFVRHMK